jgi:plasmanylethanolamine desaturase
VRALRAHGPYGYSRGHRLLEIAAIGLFLGTLTFIGVRIALAVKGTGELFMVATCAGIGLLVADLVSGMAHWAGDTLMREDTPVVGPHFIRPFREHHTDPKAITRHDFTETNGNNCIASMPMLGAVAPVMPADTGLGFYACALVFFTSVFLFGTNQFHKWAHADQVPRLARFLQRWGLILPPSHHGVHHAAPHDKYYCITVGWMNPILHWLRFFRALEWSIGLVWPRLLHLEGRSAPVAERVRGRP